MSQALNPWSDPRSEEHQTARSVVGDVMRQQADRELTAARPPAPRRDYRSITIVAVLSLCAGVWFLDPPWLRVAEAAPPSEQQVDAGARLGLYLDSQRIEHFRTQHHQLPARLELAGVAAAGVTYTRVGTEAYTLITTVNARPITLRSTDDMKAFLSAADKTLKLAEVPQP